MRRPALNCYLRLLQFDFDARFSSASILGPGGNRHGFSLSLFQRLHHAFGSYRGVFLIAAAPRKRLASALSHRNGRFHRSFLPHFQCLWRCQLDFFHRAFYLYAENSLYTASIPGCGPNGNRFAGTRRFRLHHAARRNRGILCIAAPPGNRFVLCVGRRHLSLQPCALSRKEGGLSR